VPSESRDYVQTILGLYLQLPETPAQSSRLDRQLALEWFKQKIPLPAVEAAFLLASARRLARGQKATRLGPIRSLHYFVPVLGGGKDLRSRENRIRSWSGYGTRQLPFVREP
jgi:hypothetical protein